MTSLWDSLTLQWRRRQRFWPLLLAAGYLGLIPALTSLHEVVGVVYLLAASAAVSLLVALAELDWRRAGEQSANSPPVSLAPPLACGVDALRALPRIVLWLPLPVSFSWVAAEMARVTLLRADYYFSFGLWLVAIILFVAILLVPLTVQNRERLSTAVRAIPWPEVVAVAFITGVACAVRFIDLANSPGPFWTDEGFFASRGLEVAQGARRAFFDMGFDWLVFDMYYLTIGLPFKLFGPSVLWARLPQAVIGTVTVPLLYLMLREMFDRRVALVGAAFMAVNHFHTHFSRIVLPNVYDAFFTVLVLLFAFRAIRRQRLIDFALAGLAAGLQFYFFSGARLLPLVLVILLAYMALKTRGRFVVQNFWGLGVLLAGFVISSLPAALFWDANPGTFDTRWEQQNIFDTGWLDQEVRLTGHSEVHVLWDQFQHSIGALVVYDDVYKHYNAGIPLLTAVSSVLFVIGGVYGLVHLSQLRFIALYALLVLTVIFLGTLLSPPVESQRYLNTVPVSAAFVGLGAVVAADAAAKVIPQWRSYAPAAVGALVLLIAFVDVSFYFGDYAPSDNYGLGRGLYSVVIADQLEQFDDGYAVYFFGVPGFTARDPALAFRTRDKILVEVHEGGGVGDTYVGGLLPGAEQAAAARERAPNALFLVPSARRLELAEIVRLCPNGVESDVFTLAEGFTYVWYEVSDAPECVQRVQRGGILNEEG